MRLLFVEDEPDLGALIKRTLERERYIVDRNSQKLPGHSESLNVSGENDLCLVEEIQQRTTPTLGRRKLQ